MKISFVGAGKMAEGMISAMDEATLGNVAILERDEARAAYIAGKYGVKKVASMAEAMAEGELVFLCVRPQDLESVAAELKGMDLSGKAIASIVAGKTIAKLQSVFGESAEIIRIMPNLALRAKAGMCAICPSGNVKERFVERVREILSGAGKVLQLAEKHFDAVTALSGSGPAYFAYMLEAMILGGCELGLSREDAEVLATQTMYGTGKFLSENKVELSSFIDGVCTKGGTTAAGMQSMAGGDFRQIVAATLQGAAHRSQELSRE